MSRRQSDSEYNQKPFEALDDFSVIWRASIAFKNEIDKKEGSDNNREHLVKRRVVSGLQTATDQTRETNLFVFSF